MIKSRFHIASLFISILFIHVLLGIFYTGYSYWWITVIILGYIFILFLGSVLVRWNFYIKSQLTIPFLQVKFDKGQLNIIKNTKQIALTFDDGPAEHTEAILDILKKEKVQASFFLIGDKIAGKEHLVKRMKDEGHIIGNHSFYHSRNFDWQSSNLMVQEIGQTNQLIEDITGDKPLYFRPPYGVTTPNLAKAIRSTEMKSVAWNVRSFDTMAKSEEKLLQRILKQAKPNAIILLHDRCEITAKVLPQLIFDLRAKGFDLSLIN